MTKNQNRATEIIKNSAGKDSGGKVQKKAFELYVKRGKRTGHAMDDWLEAERMLKHRTRL